MKEDGELVKFLQGHAMENIFTNFVGRSVAPVVWSKCYSPERSYVPSNVSEIAESVALGGDTIVKWQVFMVWMAPSMR